jgi:hypothetical protein
MNWEPECIKLSWKMKYTGVGHFLAFTTYSAYHHSAKFLKLFIEEKQNLQFSLYESNLLLPHILQYNFKEK